MAGSHCQALDTALDMEEVEPWTRSEEDLLDEMYQFTHGLRLFGITLDKDHLTPVGRFLVSCCASNKRRLELMLSKLPLSKFPQSMVIEGFVGAAVLGNRSICELLLEHFGGLIATRPLCPEQNESFLKILPEVANGMTALQAAAFGGSTTVCQRLLDEGADILARNKNGMDCLMFATTLSVTELLLRNNSDAEARSNSGETALSIAAQGGKPDVCQALLEAHADVLSTNSSNDSPITQAASNAGQNGCFETVKLLLSKLRVNCCTNINQLSDSTALGMSLLACIGAGCERTCALLLSAQADPNYVDSKREFTPITIAAQFGDLEVMEMLRDAGAELDTRVQSNFTPLHIAAFYGHSEACEYLIDCLDSSSETEVRTCHQATPLMLSAHQGHHEATETLLALGADLHAGNSYGGHALHFAAREAHRSVVSLLLQNGACASISVLKAAILSGDAVILKQLLVAASVTSDLLLFAAAGGKSAMCKLLQNSISVNVLDSKGRSPLMLAARYAPATDKAYKVLTSRRDESTHALTCRYLLRAKADVNAVDYAGNCVLFHAITARSFELSQLLIEHGADLQLVERISKIPAIDAIYRAKVVQVDEAKRADEAMSQLLSELEKEANNPKQYSQLSDQSNCGSNSLLRSQNKRERRRKREGQVMKLSELSLDNRQPTLFAAGVLPPLQRSLQQLKFQEAQRASSDRSGVTSTMQLGAVRSWICQIAWDSVVSRLELIVWRHLTQPLTAKKAAKRLDGAAKIASLCDKKANHPLECA